MNETILTLVGNLTKAPEIRYTKDGQAVANFTIASTPRAFNKKTNDWQDGETMFLRCTAWRELAENIGESGWEKNQLIVTGSLRQRSFETREGEKRTSYELDVTAVGASVAWGTANFTRVPRGGGGGRQSAPSASADPFGDAPEPETPPF